MSNPERVRNNQKGHLPRRGRFVALHILLYLITVVRLVMALYIYYIDLDTKYPSYVWILVILLPALLLFARDMFVLFRKRTAPYSLILEIMIMIGFLSWSNIEVNAYAPDWIVPPHSDPSFYIASSVSMFFDLLLLIIAILDLSITFYSLGFYLKKSARRRASSSSLFGKKRTSNDGKDLREEIWKYAFEHSVFRKKEFEPTWLAIIRGLLATIIITLLVAYGLDVAIRQPVAERAKGPSTRSGQLSNTTDTYFRAGFLDNMAFIIGSPKSFGTIPLDILNNTPSYFAPNVTTIQTISINGTETTCYPSSRIPSYTSKAPRNPPVIMNSSHFNETEVAFINCSRTDQAQESLPYTLDIQVGVDYSQWNTTSPSPDNLASFNVYMMAADQIMDVDYLASYVLPSMTPFPLRRNAHLRGTVNVVIRRVIIPSWMDFLGFPPDYIEFLLFSLGNLFPDTSSTFSPNTSWVVFTSLFDSPYVVVLEDYRQYTFSSGLASVGGIITIIDGIFAMIFGMGLISILSGSKAISPFGIVGLIIRESLQEGMHKKYPQMKHDLRQGGMASFLRDVEIEVGLLDRESDEQEKRNTNRGCDTSGNLLTNLEEGKA